MMHTVHCFSCYTTTVSINNTPDSFFFFSKLVQITKHSSTVVHPHFTTVTVFFLLLLGVHVLHVLPQL